MRIFPFSEDSALGRNIMLISEPVLIPIRKMMGIPSDASEVGFDLSPIVAYILLDIINGFTFI